MGKLIQLSDYRKFDGAAYVSQIKQMTIPDLLLEMSTYSEQWRESDGKINSEFKKKGLILFTEIYHVCQTPEMRQAALTALAELEKANE